MNLNKTHVTVIYFPDMIHTKTILVLPFRVIYLKEAEGQLKKINKMAVDM